MTRINAPKIHVLVKAAVAPVLPEPKAVVALPVMTERVRTANVVANVVVQFRDVERDRGREDSPWRTVSRAPNDDAADKADHGGISGKSFIDPEVLRRQRAEETRVYGENACQALFQSRPDAIVRAGLFRA